MPDTVLIINGATRVNGNTDIIIEKIIEGAKNNGVNVKFINLREKKIANCIGCYQCLRESTCSFDDDMTYIRKYINETEVMILASPLYWCGVTGLMKTFLDRLFFYYHSKNRTLIAGKQVIIVTPMNQKDIGVESEPYSRVLQTAFQMSWSQDCRYGFLCWYYGERSSAEQTRTS